MTMLTDQQLAEIRAREQAATPGPWVVTCHKHDPHADYGIAEQGSLYWRGVASVGKDRNVAFIAHSRTDIPALLAHIEEQRREMEHYKRALGWMAHGIMNMCNNIEGCSASGCPFVKHDCERIVDMVRESLNATKEASDE